MLFHALDILAPVNVFFYSYKNKNKQSKNGEKKILTERQRNGPAGLEPPKRARNRRKIL